MKKLILMSAVAALSAINVNAQSVPNGSFENWTSTPYESPAGWSTSNSESLRKNLVTATKVAGVSGSAIRLETHISGGDTSGGFVINSEGNPEEGDGGVPYSQQPTHITGMYRYNLAGNDSAIMLVFFKKNGAVISSDFFKIRGTGSQNTFASFSFPLSLSAVPDSVIIGAASSNLIENVGIADGSFIELDNIAFSGPGITQAIPNGDFTTWTNEELSVLNNWDVNGDEGVTRVTDAYKGTFAIRLETIEFGDGFVGAAGVTTGRNGQMGPNGGNPFTNQIDTLYGYYKYTTPGTDSAQIQVSISKDGMNIGGRGLALAPAASYTYFEIPIQVGSVPDSMRVEIYSSRWQNAVAGSVLIIDEVQLKSEPLNTGLLSFERSSIRTVAYPNPVKDQLNISLGSLNATQVSVRIMDLTGRLMSDVVIDKGAGVTVNTGDLKPGVYFYQLQTETGAVSVGKFSKE